jgi:hypothetical protein
MPLENLKGYSPTYSAPAPSKPMGGLERIFDLLNRPGAAVRGGVYGFMDEKDDVNPLTGAWQGLSGQRKYDSTELLGKAGWDKPGWGRSAVGFGLDIATDPLTYAGGALFKGAAKGAGLIGRGATKLGEVSPLVRRGLDIGGDIKNYAGYVFNPAHNLPKEYGELRRLANANLRNVRQNVAQTMEEMFKGLSPTQRRIVLAAQEAGWARDPALEAVRGKKAKWLSDLFDEEARLGLQAPEAKLTNYAEHVFRKGDEYALKNKVGRLLSAKLGFAKKRTIATLDDALKAGAESDAALAGFHRGVASKKATTSAAHILETAKKFGKVADETGEYGEGFAKLVGGKRPAVLGDARFFNQMVDMGDGKLVKLKDIGLPEPILKDLYATFIRIPKDEKLPAILGKAMGALNRVFREGATVLRPGFHATNLQGNLWNMNLGGMNLGKALPDTLRRAKQLFGGKPVYTAIGPHSAEDIARAIDRFNISTPQSTFAGSMGDDIVDRLKMALDGAKQGKPWIGRRYKNFMQKVGSSIEGGSKEALFLNELRKGKSLEEAAGTVNKYLFDYADLTQKERAIRNYLPFYTWSRKNIPLQAEMLLKKPRTFGYVPKFKHAVEDVTAGEGKLVADQDRPAWMREEGGIQLPWSKQGEARYWQPYLPYKDLNMLPIPGISRDPVEVARDLGSMLTPYLKMPIEVWSNKNLLTGNRLYDEKLGYLWGDWQKRKNLPFPAPAVVHHVYSNVNPFLPYLARTAESTSKNDVGGILSSLGIRAPLMDAATVARDKKKARTIRKQTVAAQKRQPTPFSDAAELAKIRALRIMSMMNDEE